MDFTFFALTFSKSFLIFAGLFCRRISADNLDLSDHHVRAILHWSVKTDRLISLAALVDGELSFLWILPPIQETRSLEWLDELVPQLERCDFERQALVEMLKAFAKERDMKLGQLMVPLRLMLGGITQGPGVADILDILGKESALTRIRRQIQANEPSKQAN